MTHSGKTRRRPPVFPCRRHAATLVAATFFAAMLAACGGDTGSADEPSVPDVADGDGEPQVVAKIRAARRAAIDEPTAARFGRLGMIFQAHELHPQAVASYREAAARSSEARWPYLAALSAGKTDLEAAVELFDQALERGAQLPALHVHYGDVLNQLGRADQAAEQYRRALELETDTPHARYGLAQLALARGELDAAREELERAVAGAPGFGEAHALLAQVYQRLGRAGDARRELLRAGAHGSTATRDPLFLEVQAEAVSSRAFTDRGRRLAARGDYVAAEAQFRRVLEIRVGNPRDYANLGGALAGQGRIDDAIEEYQKAFDLDPDSPYAHNNLGLTLMQKGDLDAAVEHLERAVEVDPTYAEAHHNLGLAYARQGRLDEAIASYRGAIEIDPSLATAYNDLGTAEARRGDLDAAIAYWRTALEIDFRGSLSALYNLCIALTQRGEHEEVIERLRQGLTIAPNSSRLTSLLAWELATAPRAELRDAAAASELARRVYQAYPQDPQFGDVMAAALAGEGRFDEAVEIARRAAGHALEAGNLQLAGQIQERVELYARGESYRQ